MMTPLTIGTLRLPNNLLLAPMAGVTNLPLRLLCREQEWSLCIAEIVCVNGLVPDGKKTEAMLREPAKMVAIVWAVRCAPFAADRLDKIEKGRSPYQMQSLDQHLVQLCQQDVITFEQAQRSTRSMDLERKLIFSE